MARWFLNKRFSTTDIRALRFAFKVWLATALLAPVFTTGYYSITQVNLKHILAVYAVFVLTGAGLSAPSFLIFSILCMVVAGMHWQVVQTFRKTILSALGFLFTLIPFSLMGEGAFGGDLLIFLPYVCFVVAGIWHFKLAKNEPDDDLL